MSQAAARIIVVFLLLFFLTAKFRKADKLFLVVLLFCPSSVIVVVKASTLRAKSKILEIGFIRKRTPNALWVSYHPGYLPHTASVVPYNKSKLK